MTTTTCATCATTTAVAGGGGGGGGGGAPQLLLKETPKAGGRGKKKQFQVVMRTAATTLENTRISLLRALSTQAASQSRRSIENLAKEVVKYTNPRKSEARNLEEALMTVPDLETIPYTVIRQEQDFEIREVESYVVAETVMPGRSGFDFAGSGQAFNALAAYLFGKNTKETEMAMTTPVLTQRVQSEGVKMEMTTPVIQQVRTESKHLQTDSMHFLRFSHPRPYDNEHVQNESNYLHGYVAGTYYST
jgi:hypothetical protein